MKRFVVACAFVAGITLFAPAPASAQVFTDNFDTYVTGSTLPPQGGWADFGGTQPITVSATQAFSAPNSMRLQEGTSANSGYGSDIFRNFFGAPITTGTVTFSYRQFVEPTVDTMAFNFISTGAMPSTFQTGLDIRTVADGTGALAGGTTVLAVQGATIVGSAPQVFGAWAAHNLVVNLDANTFTYGYNGSPVAAGVWDAAAPVSFGGINFWMQFNNPNGLQDFVYYDDFSLSVVPVPEPSSMLLAPLGFAAWKLRRRKK